jgi:hypothetical protein
MDHADFPWRPLGTLLVDKGLLTAAELEQALAEQRRSGRLLGQVLVGRGYVSALSLASALAEQHGVELQATDTPETRAATAPRPQAALGPLVDSTGTNERAWRPLGKLLVAKGFVSEDELEQALAEQEQRPERRLGEILVARRYLSGPALALALAEQHGVDLAPEDELDEKLETVIKPASPGQPTYRVYEVAYEPTYRPGSILYESTNFLEAADFACEFVERQKPAALEIQKGDGAACETVWTYSEGRAAAEAASRKNLVGTFGFDPVRWDTRGRFDSSTKSP